MNLCKPLVHTHLSFGRVSYPSVHRLLQCTLAVFPAGAPLPALPLANSSSACAVRALPVCSMLVATIPVERQKPGSGTNAHSARPKTPHQTSSVHPAPCARPRTRKMRSTFQGVWGTAPGRPISPPRPRNNPRSTSEIGLSHVTHHYDMRSSTYRCSFHIRTNRTSVGPISRQPKQLSQENGT